MRETNHGVTAGPRSNISQITSPQRAKAKIQRKAINLTLRGFFIHRWVATRNPSSSGK